MIENLSRVDILVNMIKKWKFLSRKTLLSHPRIEIVEDTIELPNGSTITYVRHAPSSVHSVAVLAVNNRGEILLQREYSYPPDSVMYQLPGGGIHPDEETIDAANRELSEESGLKAHSSRVLGSFYVDNRRSDQMQFVVECKNLYVEKSDHDKEEFIESEWVSVDTIEKLVKEGKILNVNMLAALKLYSVHY